jgi:hypothetical protein
LQKKKDRDRERAVLSVHRRNMPKALAWHPPHALTVKGVMEHSTKVALKSRNLNKLKKLWHLITFLFRSQEDI